MDQSFRDIFNDLEIPVEGFDADNGVMGGKQSKEYQCVCGVGEDRIVKCDKCGYASLFDSASFATESLEFFNSDEFGKLMGDLDTITTKDDFNALIGNHPSVTEMMDLYSVHKEGVNKQILVPKGRFASHFPVMHRTLHLERLGQKFGIPIHEEDIQKQSDFVFVDDVVPRLPSHF